MYTGAVGDSVDHVRAGLAVVNAADVTGLSEVLELLTCLNQLTGALVERIGAFDLRDLSQADAQRASSTWLVDYGRMSKGAALRWLTTARHLAKLPALADGARAGTVSMEQLGKIGELVRHVGVDQVREYDQILVDLCASAGPLEVGRACERIWAMVDPDGAEPDPEEDFNRRELTFSQLGAMLYIRGRLDPEGAAALQTAVDALMRPPRPGDERSAAQRRADAMVDLARDALANGELPEVGGERPQVGILITPEILFGTPASSPNPDCPQQTPARDGDPLTAAGVPLLPERPWLHWVGEVSAQLAQRLACDGTIWRLVLDPRTGLPLNVGRKLRIVPYWMRKAIRARDRTCRWPGCDVPSVWTDAHHLTPWWKGGATAVDEIISLCRYHHGLVHEGDWTLHMDHTTGEVWARRPNGSPYELGPSRPWTSPNHHGPRPEALPGRTPSPRATDPPRPTAT
jgi:Domain of unknown function (DUF222)